MLTRSMSLISWVSAVSLLSLMVTWPLHAQNVSFIARKDFPVGANPQSVALGDFNGDGKLDLAVANFNVSFGEWEKIPRL